MDDAVRHFRIKAKYHTEDDCEEIDCESIIAHILREDLWEPLDLSEKSPGFIIFAFSLLKCELFYFYTNLNECGVPYHDVEAEMDLATASDWHIGNSVINLRVYVEKGELLSQEMTDYLYQRTESCPVTRNLLHQDLITLELEYVYSK